MRFPPGDVRSRVDIGDVAAGAALLAAAAFFAISALRHLAIGTASSMGPGFFPLMTAAGLAIVALLIIVRAFGRETTFSGFCPSRGLVCILGAPVLFAFAIGPLGFVPTITAATLLAAASSRLMSWRFALGITVSLALLCTILFVKLLQIPVPLFGPWVSW